MTEVIAQLCVTKLEEVHRPILSLAKAELGLGSTI